MFLISCYCWVQESALRSNIRQFKHLDPLQLSREVWKGYTWGRFEINNLREADQANGATGKIAGDTTDAGILVHRYIPAVGRDNKGKADAEYAVFDPFDEAEPKPQTQRTFKSDQATINLNARDYLLTVR